jgi:hypothetical protein
VAGLNGGGAAPRTQLGLLLRLHFLVLKRQATATPGRRFITFLLVVLGAVASVLLGLTALWGMWVGRRNGMAPAALDEAVHLVFAVVYGALILSPALGFRGNEFLDVTRLFHLPVSHRTVFTASTIGVSVSGAVLFWLPPLTGVVLGYVVPVTGSWNGEWGKVDGGLLAVRMGLVLAFLFHAVAMGQLLVLVLLNFLRSRRFQDLGLVIAPCIAGAVYLGTWWALTKGREQAGPRGTMVRDLLAAAPSRWIPFLPSRWLSEAMVGGFAGGLRAWLPFLAGFVPLTALVVALAARLQERAFLGDVPPLAAGPGGSGRRIPGGRLLARFFPDPVLAVASKELRLLRREPIVKTVLIGQAFFLGLPVMILALRPRGAEDTVGAVVRASWLLPFVLVFVENHLTMNLLGLEGQGISHLRTTPVSWRQVLVGKNLCYLLGFGVANALFSAAGLFSLRLLRPERVPDPWSAFGMAVVGGTCALAVVLAVGNVLSVAMPTSLAARGRMALRQQSAFSEGCYEKLARVAVFAGTLVLVAPIPLALHVLRTYAHGIFQEPWWPAAAIVFSVAYAAALLRAALPLAERMAREGEEMILERLTRSGE